MRMYGELLHKHSVSVRQFSLRHWYMQTLHTQLSVQSVVCVHCARAVICALLHTSSMSAAILLPSLSAPPLSLDIERLHASACVPACRVSCWGDSQEVGDTCPRLCVYASSPLVYTVISCWFLKKSGKISILYFRVYIN
jgi:hypothetical protein